MAAINKALTPSRFLSNIWQSPRYTGLQAPSDPIAAKRRFCRAGGGS
jgi:hypothetical protein